METIAFLGCSRGLGRAIVQTWNQQSPTPLRLHLVSRKTDSLESLSQGLAHAAEMHTTDLTHFDQVSDLMEKLAQSGLARLIYIAGGGCHGPFGEKQWKDHLWTLQLNLLTPARILHILSQDSRFGSLQQVVFVGSQIADEGGDAMAASYAAGKAGLRGLIESVRAENPPFDLRLFRPGYMATDLLPSHSWPRQQGLAASPLEASKAFVEWARDPEGLPILTI